MSTAFLSSTQASHLVIEGDEVCQAGLAFHDWASPPGCPGHMHEIEQQNILNYLKDFKKRLLPHHAFYDL